MNSLEEIFGVKPISPFYTTPTFNPEDSQKFLEDWREVVLPQMIEADRRLRSCNPPA